MRNRPRPSRFALACLALASVGGPSLSVALAQISRDLVEEALDQRVTSLNIADTPIRDALARIEQETGLRCRLAEGVLDLMPYGERTRVSITIRDMSVRAGLGHVLDGLGLKMDVDKDTVVVSPADVLLRLGRRLTMAEVGLLSRLAGAPWIALNATGDRPPLEFRIDPQRNPGRRLEAAIAQTDASSALRQLDAACATLHWEWRPDGKRLVFEQRRDAIRRRLDQPVDLSFRGVPLDEVLTELGSAVGVLIRFEPGALQKVAANERRVDLTQSGVSVRQTLERVCGNTGLRYEITDDGVRISGPAGGPEGPTARTIEQWVRIEVEIRPGVKMDIFVRQDQLPPAFQAEAQRRLDEILRGEP